MRSSIRRQVTRRIVACVMLFSLIVQWPTPISAPPAAQADLSTQTRIGFIRSKLPYSTSQPAQVIRPMLTGFGSRVIGPPMLSNPVLPRLAPRDPRAGRATAAPVPGPARRVILRSEPGGVHALSAPTPPAPITGINHWWTYETDIIGGVGRYMVNISDGNLIAQSDDMSIANKGIKLAFRRTYNSLSQHDYGGTDGSTPSNYGNGWTNTFDTHLGYNALTNVMSVYDIDGTRYDYSANGGSWTPPPGQFAQLTWDGANGYFWTKKSGTVYYYYSPTLAAPNLGLAGRLQKIWARNHNNYLAFAYTFDNPLNTSNTNLNQIVVTAEDGRTGTLQFGNASGFRLLSSLTWPDGTQVTYGYDTAANLTQVTGPGNNAAATLSEQYAYYSGGHYLQWARGPRRVLNVSDGSQVSFGFDASNRVSWVQYSAAVASPNMVSPNSSDGSGTPYTSSGPILTRQVNYTYTATTTTVADTDLHQMTYTYDGNGRVTQTQATIGTGTLTTSQGWDSTNNLLWTKDARGNETDYAYDAVGNAIEVGQPQASISLGGSTVLMRPTSIYSYDTFNNITAYCDPVWSHANGRDWTATPPPSDSLCPSVSGSTRYTWVAPGSGAEPYGELTQIVNPLGDNVVTFTYNPSSQGGSDFGLPTQVTGTSFTQLDNSVIVPQQSFTYDVHGNVICYNKGSGWWVVQYDSLNRTTAVGDPDDNALSGVACGKTTGQFATASYTTYYSNGQIKTTQNPSERAAGVSTSFTYDADGNEISTLRHFGGTAGTTYKYYDGLERLIEVQQPQDASDEWTFPWLTRYFYDLSAGGTQLISGSSSFKAYGNLYKSQEWLGATGGHPATGWIDKDGTSYDALDRVRSKYSYPPNAANSSCQQPWTYSSCTTAPTIKTNQYDGAADSTGLLTSATDALGEKTTFNYDSLGNTTIVSFSGDGGVTPGRTYTYDPDGRIAGIASSKFGTQTYTYDVNGRTTSSSEPTGGSVTSPATLSYSYYPNGRRSTLSVSSSGLTQPNLMKYSYRVDGLLQTLNFALAGNFAWTYTAGGRGLSRSDPSGQPNYNWTYDAYGRAATWGLPVGAASSITYDPEGTLTSFTAPAIGSPAAVAQRYNDRGELIEADLRSTPTGAWHGANGFMFRDVWDSDNGVLVDSGSRPDVRAGALVLTATGGLHPHSRNWYYDAAGRQNSGGGSAGLIPLNRSFDAENHTLSQSPVTWTLSSIANGYQWGPNGHPIMIGSSPPGSTTITWETLHWDGDTLLFTSTQGGVVDDVKIGMLADYTPTDLNYRGLTEWDRDPSGLIVSAHNTTGVDYWNYGSAYQSNQNCRITSSGGANGTNYTAPWVFQQGYNVGQGGLLCSRQMDGYNDNFNIIQGIRAYDPQMQTWTSPDAYAGEVHDPATQKPYMYNRNNPFSYSDPSGLLTVSQQQTVQATAANYVENWNGGPVDCTVLILQFYMEVLGIPLALDIQNFWDISSVGASHANDTVSVGAGLNHFMDAGSNAVNMQAYFKGSGQYHAMDRPVYVDTKGFENGDILFVGNTEGVDHVAMVASTSRGIVTSVAESTGRGTGHVVTPKTWKDFLTAMQSDGTYIIGYGRINQSVTSAYSGLFYNGWVGQTLGGWPHGGPL